jgi:putative acetyltransferase
MTIVVRGFRDSDALALHEIFFSSIHQLTMGEYDEAQRNAWAPEEFDVHSWMIRISAIQPFIAMIDESIAGYADVQHNGYIDHFFVSPLFARRGVGRALMQTIETRATELNMRELFSEVSDTAQPFFAKCGFKLEKQNRFELRGVSMTNATMRKAL